MSTNNGTYGTIEGRHITEEHAVDAERPTRCRIVIEMHAEGQATVYEAGICGEVL